MNYNKKKQEKTIRLGIKKELPVKFGNIKLLQM